MFPSFKNDNILVESCPACMHAAVVRGVYQVKCARRSRCSFLKEYINFTRSNEPSKCILPDKLLILSKLHVQLTRTRTYGVSYTHSTLIIGMGN